MLRLLKYWLNACYTVLRFTFRFLFVLGVLPTSHEMSLKSGFIPLKATAPSKSRQGVQIQFLTGNQKCFKLLLVNYVCMRKVNNVVLNKLIIL